VRVSSASLLRTLKRLVVEEGWYVTARRERNGWFVTRVTRRGTPRAELTEHGKQGRVTRSHVWFSGCERCGQAGRFSLVGRIDAARECRCTDALNVAFGGEVPLG